MTTLVSDLCVPKAASPILLTLPGIVISLRSRQGKNAPVPMLVTVFSSSVDGIVSVVSVPS